MKPFQSSWADILDENSNISMASVEFGDLPLSSLSKSRSRTGGATFIVGDPDFDNSRAGVNALIKGNLCLGEETLSQHSRKRTRDGLNENTDSQPGSKKLKSSAASNKQKSQFNFMTILQETSARQKAEEEEKKKELVMTAMPPLVPAVRGEPEMKVPEIKVPETVNGSGDVGFTWAAPKPGQQTRKDAADHEEDVIMRAQGENSSSSYQNFEVAVHRPWVRRVDATPGQGENAPAPNNDNANNQAWFGSATPNEEVVSPKSIKSGPTHQFFVEPPLVKPSGSPLQQNSMFKFKTQVPVASPAATFTPSFLQPPPPPPGNPATIGFPMFPQQQQMTWNSNPPSPNNHFDYNIPAGAVVRPVYAIGPDGSPVTLVIANNNVQPSPVQFPILQNGINKNNHRSASRGRKKKKGRGGRNTSGRSSKNSTRSNTPSSSKNSSSSGSKPNSSGKKYSNKKGSRPLMELTEHQISKRKAQIELGKSTAGYKKYVATVAKGDRKHNHPKTPDVKERISKRRFDGKVRCWRRQLHGFDHIEPIDNLPPSVAASEENKDPMNVSMPNGVENVKKDQERINPEKEGIPEKKQDDIKISSTEENKKEKMSEDNTTKEGETVNCSN